MTRCGVCLAALIALGLVGFSPQVSLAIQCWLSDESGFGFHDGPYATNEIVYISGEWDKYDFPCCIGDVYMVPNSSNTWNTSQAIGGYAAKKAIQGCAGAGAFYGAILKLPPLKPGRYDIVMDEDQDHDFDYGVDYVLQGGLSLYAFEVINQTLDDSVNVAQIKAEAYKEALGWAATELATRLGFLVVGLTSSAMGGVSLAISTGSSLVGWSWFVIGVGGQAFGYATSYNGAVMSIGKEALTRACSSTASVYLDLHNDPPDPLYTEIVLLPGLDMTQELSSNQATRAAIRLGNNGVQEAALCEAFTHCYEKFLGAEEENDYEYALIQCRGARRYCDLLIGCLTSDVACIDDLEQALEAGGRLDSIFVAAEAESLQQRIAAVGFYQTEIDSMVALGMSLSEVDSARTAILDLDLAGWSDASYRQILDSLAADVAAAIPHYDGVAADLDNVIGQLEYVWTGYPEAVIAGPDSAAEGAQVALDGLGSSDPENGSLAWAWDLDMDGAFDDGLADSVGWSFPSQGDYMVGLKVTDPDGHVDVDYKRVAVGNVNDVPQITSSQPAELCLRSPVGSGIAFGAAATDPDSDPVTLTWLVDNQEVSMGSTYQFTPDSVGVYHVKVRAGDGSPLSPDNYHTWRVIATAGAGAPTLPPDQRPERNLLALRGPNPFAGTTTIEYHLALPARVGLRMFDVTGRLIRVLVDRPQQASGSHSVVWDGTDDAGKDAPAGVYFCVLDAGESRETCRIVVVR